MTKYHLQDGALLVFSVGGCEWETIAFGAGDFRDIADAEAEELVKAIQKAGSLAARVDVGGNLVIETPARGGHTSLELDLARSTAATALGLASGPAQVSGVGLQAARLVGREAEPFALPAGAELTVVVDEARVRVSLSGITAGRATAAEVVKELDARSKLKGVACVTRDGRVALTSPTVGLDSSVEVLPARDGRPDAAAPLGFVGANAISRPYQAEPARVVCTGRAPGLWIENLTASPIEWHRPTGTVVLPARGSSPLEPAEVSAPQIQRLISQGVARLSTDPGR